jgi:hypothetical protein
MAEKRCASGHRHVQILPATAADTVAAVAGDEVRWPCYAGQFPGVQVKHVAGAAFSYRWLAVAQMRPPVLCSPQPARRATARREDQLGRCRPAKPLRTRSRSSAWPSSRPRIYHFWIMTLVQYGRDVYSAARSVSRTPETFPKNSSLYYEGRSGWSLPDIAIQRIPHEEPNQ